MITVSETVSGELLVVIEPRFVRDGRKISSTTNGIIHLMKAITKSLLQLQPCYTCALATACAAVDTARIPNCWENETDCFVNSHGNLYAYPRHYYEQVAAELLESVGNLTKIIVVSNPSHWTRNTDRRNGDYSIDYTYRDNVITFFRSKGFAIQAYHSSGRPDDDFVYMCSARIFVQGGGGLSKLVSTVVTANGGRVFKPRKATI
eukprot:scaffold3693_cov117-Skeletonema_dohrnii-CCMP3373.AAC.1